MFRKSVGKHMVDKQRRQKMENFKIIVRGLHIHKHLSFIKMLVVKVICVLLNHNNNRK